MTCVDNLGLDATVTKYIEMYAPEIVGVSDDDWKRNILARDSLKLLCLESQIANLFYSMKDYPMAAARESKLDEEFPNFVARLRERVAAELAVIERIKI